MTAAGAGADDGPGDWAIDVRDLVKRFNGRAVVDHVSLKIAPGRICGFLGPNGSGKTTTLRMICGLLTPDEGSGTCLGHDVIGDRLAIKRLCGYMTQKFGLYEDLTIEENLDFVARLYDLDRRRQRVTDALDALGLASRRRQLAGTLSGGWKQRLALSACMIHEPRILLLDEPTAGVDPKARRDFWDQIHEFSSAGITVLVSTHYMDEAERCHEIAYIAYGRLMARGALDAIIDDAGLTAVVLSGPGTADAAVRLRGLDGVQVAPFGNTLHVAAPDKARLAAAVAPFRDRPDLTVTDARPTLEDVFINLMGRVKDNMGDDDAGKTA